MDYFSLLETRIILFLASDSNSTIHILYLLVIDFIMTVFISVVFCKVCQYLIYQFPQLILGNSAYDAVRSTSNFALLIWMPTTFFTSIWVWLFFSSGLIVKVIGFFRILASFIRKVLDIDNKPLRSMGYVCMFLVSLIFLIAPFAKRLF